MVGDDIVDGVVEEGPAKEVWEPREDTSARKKREDERRDEEHSRPEELSVRRGSDGRAAFLDRERRDGGWDQYIARDSRTRWRKKGERIQCDDEESPLLQCCRTSGNMVSFSLDTSKVKVSQ